MNPNNQSVVAVRSPIERAQDFLGGLRVLAAQRQCALEAHVQLPNGDRLITRNITIMPLESTSNGTAMASFAEDGGGEGVQ